MQTIAAFFAQRRFRPDWVASIAAAMFCGLTISLGNWQQGRAAEKQALSEKLEAAASAPPLAVLPRDVAVADYVMRPVEARGSFDERFSILLDNKVHRRQAGYYVATPLRLTNSDMHVLVLRGWVPAGRTREELPAVVVPQGVQKVSGLAVVPSEKILELETDEHPARVWQNLVLERYRAWSGLKLQPFVIEQRSAAADGLVREWPRPDLGIDKHRSYALQWYSLSLLTLVLYVFLNFKRIDR